MAIDAAYRPRITFVVWTYNYEKYVREAIEGALSQTYSPLEVILSDDCSQDRTFEIIQQTAGQYKGPHKILLNRNEGNLGVIGHLNRVMEMASGELIVPSGGDDVSLPHRASLVHDVWQATGGRARLICVGLDPIYEAGAPLWRYTPRPESFRIEEQLRCGGSKAVGAALAWHRSLFDVFGPIPSYVKEEDRVLPFRAALLGEVAHTDSVAVRYRIHGSNFSQFNASAGSSGPALWDLKVDLLDRKLRWLTAFRRDVLVAHGSGILDIGAAEHYIEALAAVRRRTELELGLYSPSLIKRFSAALESSQAAAPTGDQTWRRRARQFLRVASPSLYRWRLTKGARKAFSRQ